MAKKDADAAAEKTRETRDRHPGDQRLREFGFRIHSRPKDGPVTWELCGAVYTAEEAEKVVRDRIKSVEHAP